jgi:hypothetical protein
MKITFRRAMLKRRGMVLHYKVDCNGNDVLLFDLALSRINCMATLLMPLPDSDFDPTESGVPGAQCCRDGRLTALPPESAWNFVSSSAQIRPLSRKLFGNCAKTSIQVSAAFRHASNKGCRFGVDAPVDTCLEAI